MPSSLQYPLERHRDLQRRWQHLLQQTVTPKPTRVGALSGSKAIVSPVATSPVAYVAGTVKPVRPPLDDSPQLLLAPISGAMSLRPRTLLTGFIAPCLPSSAPQPPSGELWLHEIKHRASHCPLTTRHATAVAVVGRRDKSIRSLGAWEAAVLATVTITAACGVNGTSPDTAGNRQGRKEC
jgi:hypothetical protein